MWEVRRRGRVLLYELKERRRYTLKLQKRLHYYSVFMLTELLRNLKQVYLK